MSRLRLLVAGPLACAAFGLVTVPLALAAGAAPPSGAVVAVAESPTPEPTAEPTNDPDPGPTLPIPTRTPSRSPVAEPTESEEPTAAPTPTRTRVRSTPRPVQTVEQPVVRETPAEPLPEVSGDIGVGSAPQVSLEPLPVETTSPTTAPVASETSAAGDRLTRIVQLVVAAGVLLGIGGGVGLYLTRS